jgi:DNA-binding NarL/FixJ family response regulator
MSSGRVLRILLAIPHRWLADAITSLLQPLPAEVVSLCPGVLGSEALIAADVLVVDPFSAEHAGLECFQELRRKTAVPVVVVLLPADTPDYRAAAHALGVDAMVLAENANPELLDIMRRLVQPALHGTEA